MTARKPGSKYPRWAMLIVALLLPAASLLPFGSLWLWQHGYILHWAVGVCILVVAVYYLQQKLIDPVAAPAALRHRDGPLAAQARSISAAVSQRTTPIPIQATPAGHHARRKPGTT